MMKTRLLTRLMLSLVALSPLGFVAPVQAADTIDLFYRMPRIGIAFSYIGMGFVNADGDFQSLAGQQIVSAHMTIDFTPDPGVDWTNLHMDMAVPVTGAQSQYFAVEGSQLVETTPGTYHYDITTDMYNGTIYEGRFGIESYGDTPDGGIGLPGTLSASTGYYFTVTSPVNPVPEPATVALMLAGLVTVPLIAKRRKAASLI
jgi:hypothetical protein